MLTREALDLWCHDFALPTRNAARSSRVSAEASGVSTTDRLFERLIMRRRAGLDLGLGDVVADGLPVANCLTRILFDRRCA
jgi:hypothetical protein